MQMQEIHEALRQLYPDTPLVFGAGPVPAQVMLIGEAPGAEEVAQGRPFCGQAGKNLTSFLASAGISRENLYITNVCKFRPVRIREGKRTTVSNRTPAASEVHKALPLLHAEIALVDPKIIVTLGNTPLAAVSGAKDMRIGQVHGTCLYAEEGAAAGRCLFALYHPASIIYNSSLRPVYEEDLERLRVRLSELRVFDE